MQFGISLLSIAVFVVVILASNQGLGYPTPDEDASSPKETANDDTSAEQRSLNLELVSPMSKDLTATVEKDADSDKEQDLKQPESDGAEPTTPTLTTNTTTTTSTTMIPPASEKEGVAPETNSETTTTTTTTVPVLKAEVDAPESNSETTTTTTTTVPVLKAEVDAPESNSETTKTTNVPVPVLKTEVDAPETHPETLASEITKPVTKPVDAVDLETITTAAPEPKAPVVETNDSTLEPSERETGDAQMTTVVSITTTTTSAAPDGDVALVNVERLDKNATETGEAENNAPSNHKSSLILVSLSLVVCSGYLKSVL